MDVEDALLLVIPAILLLLAAGGLAGFIEKAVYQLSVGSAMLSQDAERQARLQSDYSDRRAELNRLRDEKTRLDSDNELLVKERANLQDQERRMADRQNNMVAEAGHPAPGTPGFYFLIEGPSAVMPFAGLASLPTATGGKRRVRLVVWAANMAAAQAVALNWAGDGAKMLETRDFAGTLFWHEA